MASRPTALHARTSIKRTQAQTTRGEGGRKNNKNLLFSSYCEPEGELLWRWWMARAWKNLVASCFPYGQGGGRTHKWKAAPQDDDEEWSQSQRSTREMDNERRNIGECTGTPQHCASADNFVITHVRHGDQVIGAAGDLLQWRE